MNEKIRYFNFPIVLLQGFMVDSRGCLNNIFYYTIYKQSLKYELGEDKDKIKSSMNYFKVKGSISNALFHGKKMFKEHHDKNHPYTKISLDVYFDYFENDKTKTNFEKICLLFHLALLSTNKNKPYTRASRYFIYSRMDGKTKSVSTPYKKEYEANNLKMKFPDPIILENISKEVRKYATERYWTKIKKELVEKWYWNIPKQVPFLDDKGKLRSKQVRRINYFTQLKEEDFYKIIIIQEEKKHKIMIEKQQKLNKIISNYNKN